MGRRTDLIAKHSGKAGLRGRIDAKCIECIFDPEGGGGSWRQQVEACTSICCPLYDVRPKSKQEKIK